MNIADILRTIADFAEHQADPGRPDPSIQNPAELVDVQVVADPGTKDAGDKTPAGNDKEPEIFLPPLQQKQELLKKAVGVENIYDDGTATEQAEAEETEEDTSAESKDIVDRIKQLSGIPTAAVMGLSDDEPLES